MLQDKHKTKRQDTYDETFPPLDNFQNMCTCRLFDIYIQVAVPASTINLKLAPYTGIYARIHFYLLAIMALAGPVKGMMLIFLNPASLAHSSKSVNV